MDELIETLDVTGLMCPLPVLKARKALGKLDPGTLLRVLSTDPASVIDVPHFCQESGHELIAHAQSDGVYRFDIKRK